MVLLGPNESYSGILRFKHVYFKVSQHQLFLVNFVKFVKQIFGHLPRNPGPSAKNANINPRPSAEIAKNAQSALEGPGCRIIRQPINLKAEIAKASQGPADEFIIRAPDVHQIPHLMYNKFVRKVILSITG